MLDTLEFWPSANARIEQKIYNAMCILPASAIEVKSHQKVMITVSKENMAHFLLFCESARKSGALFFDERERERRSEKF